MQHFVSDVDWDDLHQSNFQVDDSVNETVLPDSIEPFESLEIVPTDEGRGYVRSIDLTEGIELDLVDRAYHEQENDKEPEHEHLVQFTIVLAGGIVTSIYPAIDPQHCYLSGSGISHSYSGFEPSGQLKLVNVEIEPQQLRSFFVDAEDELSRNLLIRSNEWKASFFPKVTPAIRAVAEQLFDVPFRGALKRMYLQAKVFELLTLQLDAVLSDVGRELPSVKLKPETVARLHHAKEILANQLENPPSLSELARQVGLSERSLQRGFKLLFEKTMVSYLSDRRMDLAEQLLRQGNCTVAAVANRVGCAHLGHFATAFKRRFGITPSQCLAGSKIVR